MLTILKIVAGIAAIGVICLVLIAVVSGLLASAGTLKKKQDPHDR